MKVDKETLIMIAFIIRQKTSSDEEFRLGMEAVKQVLGGGSPAEKSLPVPLPRRFGGQRSK